MCKCQKAQKEQIKHCDTPTPPPKKKKEMKETKSKQDIIFSST